jgi:hypothetical protein
MYRPLGRWNSRLSMNNPILLELYLVLLFLKKGSIKRAYSPKAKSSNLCDFLVAKNTIKY